MYEKIYKNICRLCLKHDNSGKMFPLFDKSSEDGVSFYGKSVQQFVNISIQKESYLPSYMCQKCLYMLKQCITFKLQSESSENKLKLLLETIEHNTEDLKEKVFEYTIFKQYFQDYCTNETPKSNIHVIKTQKIEDLTTKSLEIDKNFQDNIDDDFDDSNSHTDYPNCDDDLLDKLDTIIGTDKHIHNISFKHMKKKIKLKLKSRIRYKQPIKETEYVCRICNKVLANPQTYDNHMQRHNGCRYICEHCGKGFPVSTELQIHLVSRHGSGPCLQCQHCPFKTARKIDLIEHERLHTGERPFTCEKCGLTFRRRGIWKKHLIYHLEKTVQCPQCPRKFYQRGAMLAHMNNVHERLYVYLCNKCGATYAKTATVRRHLAERHGIPKELQGKVIRVNKGRNTNLE